MISQMQGVVLRQIRTVRGRRIIVLFSRDRGKISAGTFINESGKNKSALALRPFAYGRYELSSTRGNFNINSAEVLKSHYRIGEHVEKYVNASYALEFTDKFLQEDEPAQGLFDELIDFLSLMEHRNKAYGTLVAGYVCRAIAWAGCAPGLTGCTNCGEEDMCVFSVEDGGLLCEACRSASGRSPALIFPVSADIIEVFRYLLENPIKNLRNLALRDELEQSIREILSAYIACHLGIGGLKSESLIV
ncbi:MAG: DNA repair protein RecO [Anaerovoracaceae bacterium]|jgi:DNA repair protein RecO (recombination protein O)